MIRGIGRSIAFKWMSLSILLATLPLAIAGFRIIQIYHKDLKKSVFEAEEMKANMVVERTEGFFEKAADQLLYLSRDKNYRGYTPFHIKNHLESILYQNDYLTELTLLNERGQETVRVSKYRVIRRSELKDHSKSKMFGVVSKGELYYGEVYLTPDVVPTMEIAVPIEEHRGRITGALLGEIHLRYLWNLIPKAQVGEKGVTYILSPEGTLIAHSDTRRVLNKENMNYLCGTRCHVEKKAVFESNGPNGEKFLNAYKRIKALNWMVLSEIPVDEAYGPILQIAHTALILILVGIAVAVILSLFLSRKLTSPIKHLSKEMGEVAKGNLDIHIQPSIRDEIGALTESFNRMVQDLKQSRKAIKETEEKYRNIFENSKDMVFITSLDGKFEEINQSAVEMLGYSSREEIKQTNVKGIYTHPDERKKFQKEVAENGFAKDFEVKLKKKDGTPLDCLITATARRDKEGCIIGYEGTIKNISYRKKMEEELYQRTKELETLHDLNVLINQTLDIDKVLPMALERVLNLTGFEMGTIYLATDDGEWLELKYHQNYPSHLAGVVKRLKRGEGVVGSAIEKRGIVTFSIDRYPSSRILPALIEEKVKTLVGIPLLSKGEAVGAICLTSRSERLLRQNDIHLFESLGNQVGMTVENTRLLEEIKGSEEKYRTVVEGVLDGIAVVGRDFKFKYVNSRLAEILGYTKEELEGMDFRKVLTEESRQYVVNRYAKWLRKEEDSPHLEFDCLRKDGEVRNIEMSNKEMKNSEGALSFISIMRDITEKKKMEEQLFQSEKLRSLGEMASGVAHDFNNALAAILGNTQLLLYTAQDEETRETLKTIETVARDSAQTVKRLQEFTRKRARQELFKVNLNSIIRDVIEITRPRWKDEAQGKGIQIEMVSHLGDVPDTAGNASEMREVITNIIFNAIEAMPMRGKIEIRSFREKDHVHIRIADTGIGMDEATRKKIFEPFFTTKPFSNTGLGLSMSYGIIKRFGGEIKVESRVGSGTTFTIILPVMLEGAEEKIPDSGIKKGKAARILVIDDEKTVREVLAKMLSHANHRVTVATSGEEGMRLFNEQEFDMVLTDLGMPGMSGWEVCKSIKQIKSSTPVGMITGWGLEVDKGRQEEAGLDFIITKPFDFNRIVKEVSEKIEQRTAA